MGDLARTLRELYDTEEAGTAFALDGLVDADVLEKWLQLGVLGQTSNQTLFLAKVTAGLLDAEIAALHGEGKTPEEIFNLLYNQEAMDSARALEHWVDARDSLAFSRETDATRAAGWFCNRSRGSEYPGDFALAVGQARKCGPVSRSHTGHDPPDCGGRRREWPVGQSQCHPGVWGQSLRQHSLGIRRWLGSCGCAGDRCLRHAVGQQPFRQPPGYGSRWAHRQAARDQYEFCGSGFVEAFERQDCDSPCEEDLPDVESHLPGGEVPGSPEPFCGLAFVDRELEGTFCQTREWTDPASLDCQQRQQAVRCLQ